jgi:hypothetical protein
MILYMFRASHAHLQEDVVYLQYLVSSRWKNEWSYVTKMWCTDC